MVSEMKGDRNTDFFKVCWKAAWMIWKEGYWSLGPCERKKEPLHASSLRDRPFPSLWKPLLSACFQLAIMSDLIHGPKLSVTLFSCRLSTFTQAELWSHFETSLLNNQTAYSIITSFACISIETYCLCYIRFEYPYIIKSSRCIF